MSSRDFRVKAIRTRVVADQAAMKGRKGDDPVIDAQSMRASEGLSQQLRMGRRCHDRLAGLEFEIDGFEMMAGRIKPVVRSEDDLREAREYLAALPGAPGQTGHCEIATDDLLALGIDGLIAKVAKRRETAHGAEQAEVCDSFIDA